MTPSRVLIYANILSVNLHQPDSLSRFSPENILFFSFLSSFLPYFIAVNATYENVFHFYLNPTQAPAQEELKDSQREKRRLKNIFYVRELSKEHKIALCEK